MSGEDRRRVGTWLAAVGFAVMAVFAAQHVASSLIGSRLVEGRTYRWDGEPLYVQSLDGTATCVFDRGEGVRERWIVGDTPTSRERAWNLEKSNEYFRPGGELVGGESGGRAELSCSADMRVGSGWPVYLYLLAEGGLLTVVPAAAASVVGLRLRRPARA
jgi:hypothetical protein